jgi:hypothetical protein
VPGGGSWCHGTRGSTRAALSRDSGAGATGHVAAALSQEAGTGATGGVAALELPVPLGITRCHGHVGACEGTSCPSS